MTRPIVLMHTDRLASGVGLEIAGTENPVGRFICTRSREDALVIAQRIAFDAVALELTGDTQDACALVERMRDAGYRGRVLVLLEEAGAEASARLLRAGAGGVLPSANSPTLVVAAVGELVRRQPTGNRLAQSGSPVSERDRSVLQLVWDGKSNKEIASRLNCSVSLVKATLQRMFARTGVRTRTQLLRLVMADRKWLHPPVAPASNQGPAFPR